MATATKKAKKGQSSVASDETIQHLAKIAFGNVLDFARFEPGGRVHIFDWDKAREVGAKVSVVPAKLVEARTRITEVKIPDKFPALMKLFKLFCPPQTS